LNDNLAQWGGGAAGGILYNCTLFKNASSSSGGATRGAAVYNCTIFSNSASSGAAGDWSNMSNCLVFANSASSYSGGATMGTLNNCTIVGNSAGTAGGGVYGGTLINCIVYFNTATTDGSNWYSTASFTKSCTAPDPGGVGNITADPMFVDTNTANYRLNANSPCINAGINQNWMTNAFDLDGHRRIDRLSGRVDIGVYEFIHKITLFSGH
jgi:hypothetical protein